MNVHIQVASPSEIEPLKADLVDIYLQAFRDPPYSKSRTEVDEFAHFLPIHAVASGFRLIIAIDSEKEKTVGFTYGRTATKGQPWHDMVETPLQSAGLAEWLIDAYQIVEMAVIPTAQRHGIGSRLHDRLLEGLPHKRALLTTIAAESAAYHLYSNKGWKVLLKKIIVPQYPRTYRIVGLELPFAQGNAAYR
jgi:hypothetical protein